MSMYAAKRLKRIAKENKTPESETILTYKLPLEEQLKMIANLIIDRIVKEKILNK